MEVNNLREIAQQAKATMLEKFGPKFGPVYDGLVEMFISMFEGNNQAVVRAYLALDTQAQMAISSMLAEMKYKLSMTFDMIGPLTPFDARHLAVCTPPGRLKPMKLSARRGVKKAKIAKAAGRARARKS